MRALCKTRSLCNSASGGVEAHSLFVGSSCEDEVCLDWGFGTREKEFVQACVCTSTNPKNKSVVLCLVGSSLEDESAFGLRFWQVQKGVCSSLCLHIHKPKKNSRTESGFFKKNNSHPVTLIAKKFACPLPPIQCWERLSKKNSHFGLDAGMHWAATLIKGARGDQV